MKANEQPLDKHQGDDLYELFHAVPVIQNSYTIFTHITTSCPPEINVNGIKDAKLFDDEFDLIVVMYWLPYFREVYKRLKIFGICPWYFVPLQGTQYRIPIVPPYNSGYITTYMDKNHRQRFKWYWDGSKDDFKMNFELEDGGPNIDGTHQSVLCSLLSLYRVIKNVSKCSVIVHHRQAHPESIIEYNPPRNVTGDDDLVTLSKWPEEIAGTINKNLMRFKQRKLTLQKSELNRAIQKATVENLLREGPMPLTFSETRGEQNERHQSGLIQQSVILPPFYSYKAVQTPKLDANITQMYEMLTKQAQLTMDVPSTLSEQQTSKTKAAASNSLRVFNETVKYWLRFFENLTLKAILSEYGTTIQTHLDDLVRRRTSMLTEGKFLKMNAEVDIKVEMRCLPILSQVQLEQYYMQGLLEPKTYVRHVAANTGIPESELKIPPRPPPPFQEEQNGPKAKRRKKTVEEDLLG
jgi:hypothetical protein